MMKIVGYRTNNDLDIEFQDNHKYVKEHQTYSNFKTGGVKNPYDITIVGVGWIGHGKYKTWENDKPTLAYTVWKEMLTRCYYEKRKNLHGSYYDKCTVCTEWFDYQVFAEWYEKRFYNVNERLHIDKDILFPNCHYYSPDTCLLVPQRINLLFMVNGRKEDGLPQGIRRYDSGRYHATYNTKNLGMHDTLEKAFLAYKSEKENTIKEIANEYINIIPIELYDALIRYEVTMENSTRKK